MNFNGSDIDETNPVCHIGGNLGTSIPSEPCDHPHQKQSEHDEQKFSGRGGAYSIESNRDHRIRMARFSTICP
jgi:hypothetical protein